MLVATIITFALILGAAFAHWRWDFFRRKVHPWLVEHATLLGAYRSIFAIIGFPLVILGAVYTYQQLSERFARPDVALSFASPKEATISVWNISSTVVRDPKYQVFIMFIFRRLHEYSGRTGDRLLLKLVWGAW